MERIAGENLASGWDTLKHNQKKAISQRLREYWEQLPQTEIPRFLLQPQQATLCLTAYFGVTTPTRHGSSDGPFKNEDQLNATLVKKYMFK
ncbi:hypothetical protein GX50_02206 [[Emmonsia] crescens]|uniref:Uncharacterized protein n=1 Tax=[Emmonsia] crescens TaxID=73230 RepID=A0A2B7ZQA2_9EURO|nr:hypothetical protein GX50_02206 [Emmonsia crescens]